MDYHYYFQRFLRLGFVFLTIIGITFTLLWSWKYLSPFVIAFVLAAILQPFIQLLENRFRIPKILAILFVLILFVGLAGSLVTLLVAELIKGIQYLATGIPGHFQRLAQHIMEQVTIVTRPIVERLEKAGNKLSVEQQQSLERYIDVIQEKISHTGVVILNEAFENMARILSSLPSSLTYVFITLLATFFICKDWKLITSFLRSVFPKTVSEKINTFRFEMKHTLHGLIKAQCTLVFISTVIVGIGLAIIDAPHFLTITFIAAIVDFVPYIGTGTIFIPWILYQFFSGEFGMTIALAFIYMIVVLTRQILEPKLLADHIGVPPILLLMSLFVGFKLFGAYGMILSPMVLMIIQTLNKSGVTADVWTFIKGNEKPPPLL